MATELLRVKDLALLLGLKPCRVRQLISARELPATRVGNALCVPRAAWQSFLDAKSADALAHLHGTPTPRRAARA